MTKRILYFIAAALPLAAAALFLSPATEAGGEHRETLEAHSRGVVLQLMEMLSSGDFSGVEKLVGEGGDYPPSKVRNMQELRRTYFPDLRYEVEEVLVDRDRVAVWYRATGTHTGGDARISATGNDLDIPEVALFRLVEGKVVDRRLMTDLRRLQSTLGFREVPPTAK